MHSVILYLEHLVKAKGRHGVHSPFIYDLINKVLRPKEAPAECQEIEAYRRRLLASERTIPVLDLGAGSRRTKGSLRRVAEVTRTAVKGAREAMLLYRAVEHFRPTTVLELGTSFGISALYMAAAMNSGQVTTLEGCPETLSIARDAFRQLGHGRITPVQGDFKEKLPAVLAELDRLDLVHLDGHHELDPTLDYFEQCLGRSHNNTVIIVDDIHWSAGMSEAWSRIKAHPRVTVTVDLYRMGFVFLRTEQSKEHFTLRYRA
ncbi:MAG: class I SAM-dependent methyltransferase [Flavobacteriales bacterium]|nr:class I SAM-dependent methyltransferase [Flavobacteriales bacterium]